MTQLNQRDSRWRGRILRYGPLVLWIGLIVFASTAVASMSNTSRFIGPLLRYLFPGMPEETLIIIHGLVRKGAHVAEYAGLAFWASRAFWGSFIQILRKYWFLCSFLLLLTVASFDEFNQSFEAARTGSAYDVMLDGVGGLGMLSILCIYRVYLRRRNEREIIGSEETRGSYE